MRYVLYVKDPDSLIDVISEFNVTLEQAYGNMPNFGVIDTDAGTAQRIRQDARVKYVRPDQPNIKMFPIKKTNRWNLSAVCRTRPLMGADYYASTVNGSGVDAYVVDSGIRYDHIDFEGRAKPMPGWQDPWGHNNQDSDGHGTHVAGLIGGVYSGIAPGVRLYSVRVFGPRSTDVATPSQFLGAVDSIIAHHISKNGARASIVNMSLGASPSSLDPFVFKNDPTIDGDDYLDDSVAHLVAAGIQVCVAAGNGLSDDTTGSLLGRLNAYFCRPARAQDVITVGAIDFTWNVAHYSNYGDYVDIYAPGTDLLSANVNRAGDFVLMSGTSMATPVTTGVCALYLGLNKQASPADVKDWVIKNSVKGINNLYRLEDGDFMLNGGAALNKFTLKYIDMNNVTSPLFYPRVPTSFNRVLHNPYTEMMGAVHPAWVGYPTDVGSAYMPTRAIPSSGQTPVQPPAVSDVVPVSGDTSFSRGWKALINPATTNVTWSTPGSTIPDLTNVVQLTSLSKAFMLAVDGGIAYIADAGTSSTWAPNQITVNLPSGTPAPAMFTGGTGGTTLPVGSPVVGNTVACNGNLALALFTDSLGVTQNVYRTSDGITWDGAALPESSANWRPPVLRVGSGVWLISQSNSTTTAVSNDGITWTAAPLPSATASAPVPGGPGFICFDTTLGATVGWTSFDGLTWTDFTLPVPTAGKWITYLDTNQATTCININSVSGAGTYWHAGATQGAPSFTEITGLPALIGNATRYDKVAYVSTDNWWYFQQNDDARATVCTQDFVTWMYTVFGGANLGSGASVDMTTPPIVFDNTIFFTSGGSTLVAGAV